MIKRILYLLFILVPLVAGAQEYLSPATYNAEVGRAFHQKSLKSSSVLLPLRIPFFDDFRNAGPYPDESRWSDHNVLVSQSFAVLPPN